MNDIAGIILTLVLAAFVLARLRPSKVRNVLTAFRALVCDTFPIKTTRFTLRDVLIFMAVVAGGCSGYRVVAEIISSPGAEDISSPGTVATWAIVGVPFGALLGYFLGWSLMAVFSAIVRRCDAEGKVKQD